MLELPRESFRARVDRYMPLFDRGKLTPTEYATSWVTVALESGNRAECEEHFKKIPCPLQEAIVATLKEIIQKNFEWYPWIIPPRGSRDRRYQFSDAQKDLCHSFLSEFETPSA